MGDGDDSKKALRTTQMDTLSLDISTNRSSRDLLQRFMGSGSSSGGNEAKKDGGEIELNLGLSLGGRFGVDKSSSKLLRSSSVAECLPAVRDDSEAVAPPPAAYSGLLRTSSLPVETEERKRKQLQTLRRMEAKRRRSEKQRNSREGAASRGGGNVTVEEKREIEVNFRERLERDKSLALARRPVRLSSWVAAADHQSTSGGLDEAMAQSKAGSSSVASPLDSKSIGGFNIHSGSSSGEGVNQDIGSSDVARTQGREIGTNAVEDMPCVFTKGDGPHGRRVDGILYKYGKGEEVRIMCVCHGTFFSPDEFIEHAGGTRVDNPLKHIVVNPNSSSLL